MLRFFAILGALMLLAACQTTSSFDPKGKKAMTTPELKAAFVGNTTSGENARGAEFDKKYFPDGKATVSGVSRRGPFNWTGKWKIDKDMVCTKYTNGRGGCRKYYREGEKFYRTNAGTPDGWVAVKKGL